MAAVIRETKTSNSGRPAEECVTVHFGINLSHNSMKALKRTV